jgi:chaperonin cofactor prefoldin
MTLVQIPGTKFVRDTNSMALINKDSAGLEDYKVKRRLLETQKEEINKVKSELNDIRDDMKEIKNLMLQLLSKG